MLRGAGRARRDGDPGRQDDGEAEGDRGPDPRRGLRVLPGRRLGGGRNRGAPGDAGRPPRSHQGGDQQRRHQLREEDRRSRDRRLEPDHRDRPLQRVLHVPRLHPDDEGRAGRRIDRQRGLDLRADRPPGDAGLLRGQGRDGLAHPPARGRLRHREHPGQFALPGRDAVAAREALHRFRHGRRQGGRGARPAQAARHLRRGGQRRHLPRLRRRLLHPRHGRWSSTAGRRCISLRTNRFGRRP